MSLYRVGRIYYYDFVFGGIRHYASTRSNVKIVAQRIENELRRNLELGLGMVPKSRRNLTVNQACEKYLIRNKTRWSPRTYDIERHNCIHLCRLLGNDGLSSIRGSRFGGYQAQRVSEGASPKTINLEASTLKAMMRYEHLLDNVADIHMMPVVSDIGRALSVEECGKLLKECRNNRSRSLYPAVLLSIHCGLRNEELRLLQWSNVDLVAGVVVVGKSKTIAGTGRVIPLSETALGCLVEWSEHFPDRLPDHYVFPSERYGSGARSVNGRINGEVCVPYSVNPLRPIGTWKTAWKTAKRDAGVSCRWHDLRHTFVSRLGEGGTPDTTIMALAGHVSRKMLERYSHTRLEAKRVAVGVFDVKSSPVTFPVTPFSGISVSD